MRNPRARWLVPVVVVLTAASAAVIVASPASAVAGRVVVTATSPGMSVIPTVYLR